VSSKLEESDYRGAVRIACSKDSIADITDETISALLGKHPAPHPGHTFHLHCNQRSSSLFQVFQKRKLSLPSTLFLEDQLGDPMGFGHNISLT
jgi:hypothetical protein